MQKRTKSGELLLEIGSRGLPAETSGRYFNGPTDVAVHPITKDIFVSDGYGNSRIHRFSAEGEHMLSWGEVGGGPGRFYVRTPSHLKTTNGWWCAIARTSSPDSELTANTSQSRGFGRRLRRLGERPSHLCRRTRSGPGLFGVRRLGRNVAVLKRTVNSWRGSVLLSRASDRID